MGKYDKLKGKFPAFEQEPAFQEKVNEAKSAYQALAAPELVRTFSLERQKKKSCEAEIAELNIQLEALSQMLQEHFEAQGLSKFTLASGETCFERTEPYSSITEEAALNLFLKKNKMENLKRLAWQTMNALNKDRLIQGKPPLPGTQVFLKTSIRLRGNSSETSEDVYLIVPFAEK
jgi:hypothetical protein